MCLAVPGRIVEITEQPETPALGALATVDFQGNRVEVSLQMTPEADVGDWVLVHAGFALQQLDEQEARELWEYLEVAEVGQMPDELRPSPTESPAP